MLVHVIDDNASVRRALKRLLGSVGIEAETFSSAQKFLDTELTNGPSCLVLDVRMPRMSGLELQDRLLEAGREIPIVFITGHGDIVMAVEAMKKGAVDFLPKPFNDQDLIDAIHRAIAQYERRQDERSEREEILERLERLTPREREVMELVITGMLNKQVAGALGTVEKTVKVHRARVMEKMEVESLAELVRLAARVDIHGPTES